MYNDASLALIPSAVGDGVVYNARPVEVLGAELVTNGDFATDNSWIKGSGWTISGGSANASNSTADLYQENVVESGKYYKVTYTISNYVSGSVRAELPSNAYDGTLRSANGTYTETLLSGGTIFLFDARTSFTGSIDNVSVKEVLTSAQDFDFTRASEATRVLSGGRIEKVRTNSLTYSNDFSNAVWAKNNSSVASGQADRNGGTNAWALSGAVTTTEHYITNSTGGITGVGAISVWAKYNGTHIQLRVFGVGSGISFANFDLQNGVVGTNGGTGFVDSSIVSGGNGWYLCSLITNHASPYKHGIVLANSVSAIELPNFLGDGTSGIYIQNAQLEKGTVATEYIATTTTSVSVGSVNDMPRLDWSGGCPSLLLEPQRTNAITQSEYLEGYISWSSAGTTITTNDGISPDGFQNATKFTGNANAQFDTYLGYTASSTNTFSAFVKAGTSDTIQLTHTATGAEATVNVNLTNGTISSTSGAQYLDSSIVSYGNDWYRVSLTFTSGTTAYITRLAIVGAGSVQTYGWQVEKLQSYATSYIPSYGTAATRIADVCSGAGTASTFNDSEGVLFVNTSALADDGTYRLISLVDASDAGQTFLDIGYRDTDNTVRARIEVSGVLSAGLQYTISDTTTASKIAFKYKANDFALWINGIEVDTDSSGGVFAAGILDELTLSKSGVDFYGNVNQVLYFPTALSDTELEKLTTL
jgi:hypothetical protein